MVVYGVALAVGSALIVWATVSIAAQSAVPITAYKSPASSPTTISVQPVTLASDDAIPSPYPAAGEVFGSLTIPALKQTFPIVEGTDDAQLKQGVGHFVQSVMPGEGDNCVLSGHRDTVFTELGNLKIGDRVIVKTSTGSYTYEIRAIRIVDKDDRTVIVPTDHAVLTISTCYPFRYVGHAPDRYILSADLVARQ